MVINQRTGVPVAGSSASDDSCQSQPAKTPPHSSGTQAISTPTTPAPSGAGKVPVKPGQSSTSFSMDNILSNAVTKDFSDDKGDPISDAGQVDESGQDQEMKQKSADDDNSWDTSLEIIDLVIADTVKTCEQRKEDISGEIIGDVIIKAVDICEEKGKKQVEQVKEDGVDKDVSIIEISDSDVDEKVKKSEENLMEKDNQNRIVISDSDMDEQGKKTEENLVEKENQNRIEISDSDVDEKVKKSEDNLVEKEVQNRIGISDSDMDEQGKKAEENPVGQEASEKQEVLQSEVMQTDDEPTEKNEESENLAKALLQELKELSGEAGPLDVTNKTDIIQDFGNEKDAEDVGENIVVPVETKKETFDNAQSEDEVTVDEVEKEDGEDKRETDSKIEDEEDGKNVTKYTKIEADSKGEKEVKENKNEEERDDTSQDSTAEALERLTSELMFLNESLYESASESVPDNGNVDMEWEETDDKSESDKSKAIKEEVEDKCEDKDGENQETIAEDVEKCKGELEMQKENVVKVTELKSTTEVDVKIKTIEKPQEKKEDVYLATIQEKSEALSVIGMEYASSVTSESDAEERVMSVCTRKSPLAKILETSKEDEETETKQTDEKQPDGGPEAEKSPKQTADVELETKHEEGKDTNDGHSSKIDAESGGLVEKKEGAGKTKDENEKEVTIPKDNKVLANTSVDDKPLQKEVEGSKKQDNVLTKENKDKSSTVTKVGEKDLLDLCVKGLSLCLKRFPQHFKSLYRMAFIYYHSKDHRVTYIFPN